VGKSTIAKIIAEKVYGGVDGLRVRRLGPDELGNVDHIRDVIIPSMRSSMVGGGKLLIFDETEKVTPDSQLALRDPLEEWADLCRIIFITNKVDKLDGALRDRCEEIPMALPPPEECEHVLGRILAAEGHDIPADAVRAFTGRYFIGANRSMRGF